jgi:hypothetical protein
VPRGGRRATRGCVGCAAARGTPAHAMNTTRTSAAVAAAAAVRVYQAVVVGTGVVVVAVVAIYSENNRGERDAAAGRREAFALI